MVGAWLDRWRDREPVDLAALQALGLGCLVASVWAVHSGWHALGVFGLALLSLSELRRPAAAGGPLGILVPRRRVPRRRP